LVERYAIQEIIGVGGMGSVYRARDLHFPNVLKFVAVKEMINSAPDPVVRKTIVQNFEREANILVTLAHPSIPKIFDYFTHDDRSYLVEEFINGKDLEAILSQAQGFFPEERIAGWAIELCDVLNYLHTHKPEPIIFRDMKPSNIMINQTDHVVLVDFGIAKVFRVGQKGTMIGTEGYSPPEQYRGEASPLADIYSLGATLHHALTRRDPRLEPPFTFSERPIRQINPSVSMDMEVIVNTALQYNPSDRFQSIADMKESLMVLAGKTGMLSKVAQHIEVSSKDGSIKPVWIFACEDEIRGSPVIDNGILYVGTYDHNLYAINANEGKLLWKFPTAGGVVSKPAVSNGFVFFGSEDQNLYAVSARQGKLSWSYKTEGPIRSSPLVSEGHVFIGSDDGNLHAVNLVSTRRTFKIETGGPIRSSPTVVDDTIFFGSESGEVFCVSYQGQVRWRFSAKRAVTSSPLYSKGTVYFASLDSTFYALDSKSGWPIWRFRMGKGSVSSPCIADGILFIGSADGYIYAIDSGGAKELWKFKTEHQVSGSPITYKDSLYCGSADGNLYCIEYRTGRLKWKFNTKGPITGTPFVINDMVYVGSMDKIVYALLA
jgi:eukaryotic-like serine/threonine-protein kinase